MIYQRLEQRASQEDYIHLTKTTTAQIEVALNYHRVRELYFLAVIFATTIISNQLKLSLVLADFAGIVYGHGPERLTTNCEKCY